MPQLDLLDHVLPLVARRGQHTRGVPAPLGSREWRRGSPKERQFPQKGSEGKDAEHTTYSHSRPLPVRKHVQRSLVVTHHFCLSHLLFK